MLKEHLRLWLEDILRHNNLIVQIWRRDSPQTVLAFAVDFTLSFSLRFFSFVLERGKSPENPGCFLGVKIFWNVGNFRKTDIYGDISITIMWDLAPDFGSLITRAIAQQRGHKTGGPLYISVLMVSDPPIAMTDCIQVCICRSTSIVIWWQTSADRPVQGQYWQCLAGWQWAWSVSGLFIHMAVPLFLVCYC